MPHDRNGKELAVGDLVNVPCKVTSVQPGTDYCNITVETVQPMFPGDHKSTHTFNGKQLELSLRTIPAPLPAGPAEASPPS